MAKLIAALMSAVVLAGGLSSVALAKSKPGSCGENMYFSKKLHKCVDAREKTS